MTDTLKDLLSRLEEADGPDREIDAAIARLFDSPPKEGTDVFDWKYQGKGVWHQDEFNQPHPGHYWKAEPYTASVDAALELVERVLPDADVELQMRLRTPSHHCSISGGTYSGEDINRPAPALALLTALVKAKLEMADD